MINELHTFHIPVMGLGYSIDTPVKIGRFGISSVVSIIEDELLEQMRMFHCKNENEPYVPINKDAIDHRAARITAYLNLLNKILKHQIEKLKREKFEEKTDLSKFFELLPGNSLLSRLFHEMKNAESDEKIKLQNLLLEKVSAGAIDVNIMTKLDKINYSKKGEELPAEYRDAMSALRGFAQSDLNSSVVFSAGLNPRLYAYCETFNVFFPDENDQLKKKIILKVSDYRSALIQGKFFAKKGLWVSEFRIESGLNCGGHAFATEGLLSGPILNEFKARKNELSDELYEICNAALSEKRLTKFSKKPVLKITFQGGIGTAQENFFLLDYYLVDATGWGSPFLLVPEATNVDTETLHQLSTAKKEDYYLSHSSPLGIAFHNFKESSSEIQRKKRIKKGRPGSPCYKKFLVFNTEFTPQPICTASREYQNLKINQLKGKYEEPKVLQAEIELIEEKDCICEGLGASVLLKNQLTPDHQLTAVTICPGPNLAYFSGTFSLEEMIGHIYGRINILNSLKRSHMFINELVLYLDYLKKEIANHHENFSVKRDKYFTAFKENLLNGINYYKNLIPEMKLFTVRQLEIFENELHHLEYEVSRLNFPKPF
jgi:hypothetical protein